MPQVSEKALKLAKALSDEELAYISCGNFRTGEENKSFVGNAGIKVAGAAGETTDRIKEIPCLVMADGPAGIRINREYGKDEDGIYLISDTVPKAFVEFLDDALMKMMGMKQLPEAE